MSIRRSWIRWAGVGAAFFALGLLSCKEAVMEPLTVAAVEVAGGGVNLRLGQTVQLTPTLKSAKGYVLPKVGISWSSSDAAKAAISPTGQVTAQARGPVTLTASAGGMSGTAAVTVIGVQSISLAPETLSVIVTQTRAMTATTVLDPGVTVTPVWRSLDTTIARVDSAGRITARSTTGFARVEVTAEDKKDTAVVRVVPVPVASVVVFPDTATRTVGQTIQLTATPKDSIGGTLTGRSVIWSSSDTSRATVSIQGLVTARGVGITTITATSEGKSGVTVLTIVADSPTSTSVPGTSNIFGFGVTAPDAAGGGGGGGTVAPTVDVSAFAGGWVEFSVSGQTDAGPGWGLTGADGYLSLKPNSTNLNSLGPISGYSGSSAMMLVGLFIPGSDFATLAGPSSFSYSSFSDYTRLTYSPILRQIFFVGDGLSGNNTQSASGSTQRFFVPAGAQKLVLGFADGNNFTGNPGWYGDNKGSLTVNVKRVAPAASTDSLPLQGLIAFLPMNGNTADISGSNNNFTNSGGTFVPDRLGNPASAISFAGNASQATRDMPAFPKDSFTVAFWYRVADANVSSTYSFFQWGQPTRVGSNPAVRVIIDQNAIRCNVAGDGFGLYWWIGTKMGLLADTTQNGGCLSGATVLSWRHVAIVVKGTDAKIYDNGILWTQASVAAWTAVSTTVYLGPLENLTAGLGGARQIDSFGLWNRPLSPQEVALAYRSIR